MLLLGRHRIEKPALFMGANPFLIPHPQWLAVPKNAISNFILSGNDSMARQDLIAIVLRFLLFVAIYWRVFRR
jgi:hypothetical protein